MGWSRAVVLVLLWGGLILSESVALADGGTVRRSVRQGNFQVTVFTSPTPPRSGAIDVSVMVLNARTGEPCLDTHIWVQATPCGQHDRTISQPATSDAATNKLLTATLLDLPGPACWNVRVIVENLDERAEVCFDLEVGEPLPEWFMLAGWIAWPAVAVGLYALHRLLVRRKEGLGHDPSDESLGMKQE